MILVNRGILRYSWGVHTSDELDVGRAISEAALWTKWSHRGALVAEEESAFFNLDAEKFGRICSHSELMDFDPLEYAEDFVKRMNEGEEVTDLMVTHGKRNVIALKTGFMSAVGSVHRR